MDKLVITGATGFLGSNLARLFLAQGASVYALVRPDSKKTNNLPQHKNFHIVHCSLSNVLDCVTEIGGADGFFHFAWGGVNREEIDSSTVQEANVSGSLDCVKAAHALGCHVFMDAGSRVEYGAADKEMSEDLDCSPLNEYGKAKLRFYQQAKPICESYGLIYYHLRFFSVYGNGDHPWSIISTLVRDLPAGKTVSLSACLHRWNFMYIEDAVRAVHALYEAGMQKQSGEWIVNIAGGDTRVLRSFVEEIHELAEKRGELAFGSFEQAKEGALSICPTLECLFKLTEGNYREQYSFREGILEMMKKEKVSPPPAVGGRKVEE